MIPYLLPLGGVERKKLYRYIYAYMHFPVYIYINRYIPCIYLKNIFCRFTSSCAAWIFGGSIYVILFWFILSILVITAIFNHCYTFMSNCHFLSTERYIDIQIKQGNKIFSCHPNLKFLPLQHIPPIVMLKTKETPTKSKKVVYKRMKLCVFFPLLPPIYIDFFFNFLPFPFLFFPITAQATCLYSPLYDNAINWKEDKWARKI